METTPDELWSPDAVDPYNLVPDLANMQQTVQDALSAFRSSVGHGRGTTTQRTAATAAAVEGDFWSDTTTDIVYRFNGSTWVAFIYPWVSSVRLTSAVSPASATLWNLLSINLPSNSPAGRYRVAASQTTAAATSDFHYMRVSVGATELSNYTVDFMSAQAGWDLRYSDEYIYTHSGGAATVALQTQINGSSPSVRSARLTVQFIG